MVTVNPGGGTFDSQISNASLDAQGITGGRYLVTYVAFDGAGNRIGGEDHGFFGNPLAIGVSQPTFEAAPTYDPAIGLNDAFQSQWVIGNTGEITDQVTLTTVITPIGTTTSKEFSTAVTVNPGGGTFDFTIPHARLDAQGITGGRY